MDNCKKHLIDWFESDYNTCPLCELEVELVEAKKKVADAEESDRQCADCKVAYENTNERLREALALINSMILSGEKHSATSKAIVKQAL